MRKILKYVLIFLIAFVGWGFIRNTDFMQQEVTPPWENIKLPSITPSSPEAEPSESTSDVLAVTITYISDGDTFHANINGEDATIRLIGVDTPESVNPDESKNTPEGKEASEFTKSIICEGQTVWLEYDTEAKDKYDRNLCYVYLDEGRTRMLQDILLEEGMARCMPIKPNTKYQNHFAEIEQTAKQNGTGFWGIDFWEG